MSSASPLVTITTDFGTRDPYVAAMKGVILSICPTARLVDLSHEIPAQDLRAGALFLAGSVPHFPAETIHVIVIDPGVGTTRTPVVVEADEHIFVCPDNGLLTLVLRRMTLTRAHAIENKAFMRETVSPTFHGRDIFAPTAGELAAGSHIEEVGDRLGSLVQLALPEPTESADSLKGEIIHIDHFGNCISNIPAAMLGATAPSRVSAGKHAFNRLHRTYGDVAPGQSLSLVSSNGHVEFAVRDGHGAQSLDLHLGDPVEIQFT